MTTKVKQSDELYEILRNNCVNGLPTMNTSMFSQMTEKYTKEVFRKTLAILKALLFLFLLDH